MSTLSKVTFAFHAGLSQYFLFTGSIDNPAEINNVTPSVHEGIIAAYLFKPGVLKAPDGSEFLLELSLLPAFREAKQRMIDEAQAKITEANALVQPAPVEDIAWMADLTDADKAHMKRIVEARRKGQRVSFKYSVPFELHVKLGPVPPKKKKPKADPAMGEVVGKYETTGQPAYENDGHVTDAEGCILTREEADILIEEDKKAAERVPVVVLTVPEANSELFIVERSEYDKYGANHQEKTKGTIPWAEHALRSFCEDNGLSRDDVTDVDFSQTRTREELDNLPDFPF